MSEVFNHFGGKADLYAKYRPGYSACYRDLLVRKIGLSTDSIIVDIGAGTGIHTLCIAQIAEKVVAVESDADMLRECMLLLGHKSNTSFVHAAAENMPLQADTFDFATSAQAFHLFEKEKALSEIRRILKPSGKHVLTWNSKAQNTLLFEENERILKKYCPKYSRNIHAIAFTQKQYEDCFTPETYSFFQGDSDNDEMLDKETFVFRTLSASYAPSKNDPAYIHLASDLEDLFWKFASYSRILLKQSTVVYSGKVKVKV